MIELKNVTKAYGGRVIFNELSFTIETGEFVVFSHHAESYRCDRKAYLGTYHS